MPKLSKSEKMRQHTVADFYHATRYAAKYTPNLSVNDAIGVLEQVKFELLRDGQDIVDEADYRELH